MRSSLLARGLLVGLALSFLAAPAALADDPGTTTTTTSTAATETTPTETEAAPDPWAETPETLRLRARAVHHRKVARRWTALMGKPRPRHLSANACCELCAFERNERSLAPRLSN